MLDDFRRWLSELPQGASEPNDDDDSEIINLSAIVAQLTALKHEIHLQTRSTRAVLDQNAELIDQLSALEAEPEEAEDEDEDPYTPIRPLLKTLVETADALALAVRQVESAQEKLKQLAVEPATEPTKRPGFLARLLGVQPPPARPALPGQLLPIIQGIADGYALSLRKIERTLSEHGLEPIPTVGQPFDPEIMEAIELEEGGELASGTVTTEVRRGYWLQDRPFRFAQVKVAR